MVSSIPCRGDIEPVPMYPQKEKGGNSTDQVLPITVSWWPGVTLSLKDL